MIFFCWQYKQFSHYCNVFSEKLQLAPHITSHSDSKEVPKKALAQLQIAQKLQKISKEIMIDRLNELLDETERVIAKVIDGAGLFEEDIDGLMGCLQSWKGAKKESFEAEKRKKLDEEKRKQAEEKRRRKKERKEEANKKKKEEEERKKRL